MIEQQIVQRKPDETVDEYIYRLASLKDAFGLTWYDIRDIANEVLGLNLHEDSYRKKARSFIHNIESTEEDEQIEINFDSNELLEIRKERYKLADERTQNNAIIRRMAREDTIKEIAKDFANKMNSKMQLRDVRCAITKESTKELTLLISDWHYGIEIDNYFNKYDREIAKRRIQQLQDEVIEIIEKENLTHLNVLNLGDLIAGRIHLPLRLNSRVDVITQIMEVSELLAEFLFNISQHVNSLDYYSTLDNHSRLEPNLSDSMDLETLVRITDWFLKERLKYANINIHNNEFADDIITFTINNYGYKIAGVHGHKDKPNKIIDSLSMFTQGHQDVICAAHYHHFSSEEKNETLLLSNGSLMGTDDYACNLRLNAKPSQVAFLSTHQSVCKCIYKIE